MGSGAGIWAMATLARASPERAAPAATFAAPVIISRRLHSFFMRLSPWTMVVVGLERPGHSRRTRAGGPLLNRRLQEPHLHIRPLFQVDALHKTHLASAQRHDHGRCPRAFAEESHSLHQRAVRNAAGGEDELLARSQVFRLVNALLVFDAHAGQTLFLIGLHH